MALELAEQTLGSFKVADADARLNCDGARNLSSILVHLLGLREQGLDV